MDNQSKKILFIINPISGGRDKAQMIKAIPKLLDKSKFEISITHTQQAGHATIIAKKAVEENVDIVVAVGGDGTINEIASQLVNTNTALAIIPCGSGNGLARDLKISLHYKKAIQQINALNIKQIDVGVCNKNYFFCLAGIGYDAKVAYDFNRGEKRKFLGYAWSIFKDFFHSNDQSFDIEMENEKISEKYFFITAANCSQWGYNVKVAPDAKLDDGMLNLVFCKKPTFFTLVPFVIKILSGKITSSPLATVKASKRIAFASNKKFFYHIDGDAKGLSRHLEITILEKALKIVVK